MTITQDKSPAVAEQPDTYFAPAGRSDLASIACSQALVEEEPIFSLLRESVDGCLMILSPQRELLAANDELLAMLGLDNCIPLLGLRHGEVLNCVNSNAGPDGCGTGHACRSCGGIRTILESQSTRRSTAGDCMITLQRDGYTEDTEFRVRATSVRVCDHDFIIVIFTDVHGDEWREALERTFLHDILNTIGGLVGWTKILQRRKHRNPAEIASHIIDISNRLTFEVEDHRRLLQAERDALTANEESISVQTLLTMLEPIFHRHAVSQERQLLIATPPASEEITTDVALLLRVLTNMIKNAFEAIEKGEAVRVSFERRNGDPVFLVHNSGFIPEQVALQIFQRSFSTKAKEGRGIGTYSMKLFGEKYLGGKVDFETDELRGTTFSIRLPGTPKSQPAENPAEAEADQSGPDM